MALSPREFLDAFQTLAGPQKNKLADQSKLTGEKTCRSPAANYFLNSLAQ
jgi:hypothetical protein